MNTEGIKVDNNEGPSWVSLAITVLAVAATAALYFLLPKGESEPEYFTQDWCIQVGFLISQVVLISILIWQVCDPFADAAQWIGTAFRIPGSVRGATLDAVASSMPELFSGIFFVVVAIFAGQEMTTAEAAGEGYASALATCAGSAIYNMILIPAFCALVIAMYRKNRPTIDIEKDVILRDGMWFLGCELVLLLFLWQDVMYWWMAIVFLVMYCVYVTHLYFDTRAFRLAHAAIRKHLSEVDKHSSSEQIAALLQSEGVKATPTLVDEIKNEIQADELEEEDEAPDEAGLLFGFASVPLGPAMSWVVIGVATALAAAACYWLVEVTYETARVLDVPPFFIAVILAAAASSVPDTFLSIGSATRGDDGGAVSNAFGSNIFDICICLSVPLLVTASLNGWAPVYLTDDGTRAGKPMDGLLTLRILLFTLTTITLLIMWHKRQLTWFKSLFLILLYAIFVAYAVAGSLGYTFEGLLRGE